jgi:hypothetical protein
MPLVYVFADKLFHLNDIYKLPFDLSNGSFELNYLLPEKLY